MFLSFIHFIRTKTRIPWTSTGLKLPSSGVWHFSSVPSGFHLVPVTLLLQFSMFVLSWILPLGMTNPQKRWFRTWNTKYPQINVFQSLSYELPCAINNTTALNKYKLILMYDYVIQFMTIFVADCHWYIFIGFIASKIFVKKPCTKCVSIAFLCGIFN